MSWGAVIIGGAAIIAGGTAAYSANKNSNAIDKASALSTTAAKASAAAAIRAAEIQAGAIEAAAATSAAAYRYAADLQYKTWQEQLEREQPWYDAGYKGLQQLMYGLGLSKKAVDKTAGDKGYLLEEFQDNDLYKDPGYEFRLSEGLKALNRSNSATGGLASGAALKAAETYGQDMASQEYMNAYNRYNIDQTNKYNRLAAMSGTGQVAAQQMGNTSANFANAISSLITGSADEQSDAAAAIANALAQGQIGYANAYSNAYKSQADAILAKAANSSSLYQSLGNVLTNAAGSLASYYGGGSYGGTNSLGYYGGSGYASGLGNTGYTWGSGYQGNYSLGY